MLEVEIIQGPSETSPGEVAVIFRPTRTVKSVRLSVSYEDGAPKDDEGSRLVFRPEHGGYWIDRVEANQVETRLFTVLASGLSIHSVYHAIAEARYVVEDPDGTPREDNDPPVSFPITVEAPEPLYVFLGAAEHLLRILTGVYESFRRNGREVYRRDVQSAVVAAGEKARASGFAWAVDAIERGAKHMARPAKHPSRRS